MGETRQAATTVQAGLSVSGARPAGVLGAAEARSMGCAAPGARCPASWEPCVLQGPPRAAFAQPVDHARDHVLIAHAPRPGAGRRQMRRGRRPLLAVQREEARRESSPAIWRGEASRRFQVDRAQMPRPTQKTNNPSPFLYASKSPICSGLTAKSSITSAQVWRPASIWPAQNSRPGASEGRSRPSR
jgi:hypothetical protein